MLVENGVILCFILHLIVNLTTSVISVVFLRVSSLFIIESFTDLSEGVLSLFASSLLSEFLSDCNACQ